jgi:hypothetical protein
LEYLYTLLDKGQGVVSNSLDDDKQRMSWREVTAVIYQFSLPIKIITRFQSFENFFKKNIIFIFGSF